MKKSVEMRRHRRSGDRGADRAYVYLDGERVYLGRWGSEQAKDRFEQVVAEWEAANQTLPVSPEEITIVELFARFIRHADELYSETSKEPGQYRRVAKHVCRLYGETLAKDFGPRAWKALRQQLIEQKRARGYIRQWMNRITAVFRWGVEEEVVHPPTYDRLRAIRHLRKGERALGEGRR